MKSLPKTIFVRIDRPTNDQPFFNAEDSAQAFAEVGQTSEVGEYELKRVVTVKARIEIVVSKGKDVR